MSDAPVDSRVERLEQTLDAVFAADVVKEILHAVDFEAILSDEPTTDPVDIDHLAEAVGRPVGRLLVSQLISGSGPAGLAKKTIGSEVASRAAVKTFRVTVENVDVDVVAETLVELDEEALPGPPLRDTIEPYLDESDVFDARLDDLPDDAGADADGINDAGGGDHTGPLDEE